MNWKEFLKPYWKKIMIVSLIFTIFLFLANSGESSAPKYKEYHTICDINIINKTIFNDNFLYRNVPLECANFIRENSYGEISISNLNIINKSILDEWTRDYPDLYFSSQEDLISNKTYRISFISYYSLFDIRKISFISNNSSFINTFFLIEMMDSMKIIKTEKNLSETAKEIFQPEIERLKQEVQNEKAAQIILNLINFAFLPLIVFGIFAFVILIVFIYNKIRKRQ